ncbi:uncharacterized protein LOC125370415 [Ricinus communis]|uniref:TF-B3 domain-containing protein n=1 Tax=Ricinus communis TaxID=3988 RepID=B9SR39_RICCO|nr:uncharacterized protein LOC125370415 [Ricinus communis]EEF33941.1 conserved hypothetical protein [Ricinus communis]
MATAEPNKTPQLNQISNFPIDGEVKYLFTKSLSNGDMVGGLTLIGESHNFFRRGIPNSLSNEIGGIGLDVEIFTPNGKIWNKLRYDHANKIFKLDGIEWDDVVTKNQLKVGDEIDCFSLYHAEVGPQGILSLLVQKAAKEDSDSELMHAAGEK